MTGGQLTIRGDAGPFAGSGMKGGLLKIEGDAGERLGGPLSGETTGMSGGVLHVRGDAGERAGDRLRRGFILIEGRAGDYAGSRMIAGTLAIGGEAGESARLSDGPRNDPAGPGRDASLADLRRLRRPRSGRRAVSGRLYRRSQRELARLFRRPLRRLAGDLAALGKGEILLPRG